jgi:SAM-dependent methyltransferase
VAARLLARRPGLRIVALDRAADMVARARARVTTVRADAHDLPFPTSAFDVAFARLVTRHLIDPVRALAEMRRVLRPGGRLVVVDSDDGALVMHPMPEEIGRALRAKQQTARRQGGDPEIGRRLVELIAAGGFSDIRVRTQVMDTGAVGPAVFAQVVLAPLLLAIDPDLLSPEHQAATARAIRGWTEESGSFAMTTVVGVGGTKD